MPELRDGSPPASTPSREGTPASVWREAGAAFALVFRTPLLIFLVCNLTFVTTLFALFGADVQGLAYLHPRQTSLWRMLTALAPTSWLLTLVILLGDFEQNLSAWPRTRGTRMTVVLCVLLGLPLHSLPLMAQYIVLKEEPLVAAAIATVLPTSDVYLKLHISNMLGLTATVLIFSGIIGVHTQLIGRLRELRHHSGATGSGALDEDVRWYQRQEVLLKRFLTLCAIMLGCSIVSVGALRNLLNQAISTSTETLPTAPVLGYGIYCTGLLASVYLPAHNTLKRVDHLLAEQMLQQSPGAPTTWKQRYEEQQAAHAWLGLQGSALQDLQQGLSVLTPLLASISSLVLGPG
ncbi:hypothetical protein ATI61_12724 [Archangium gephyra]|uniref:Uncharacterized protein n=1 Tax=Archangium gephyra TaxID=48 RepID=A0AAC8TKL8_9BACT|nr:hypothetical protein [Archangium gephyra]AKJ08401.1 Hypothetical protein AA314_10027 [Archangium gephyra]REG14305.1 hypothetical protein ATI61_12724 [Archangium gephyra]